MFSYLKAFMGNYLNFRIEKITRETDDALNVFLKAVNGTRIEFQPGQFLTFIMNNNGEELQKVFSISSIPSDLPRVRITVKKNTGTNSSPHFLDLINEGQIVKCLPPLGNFTLKEDTGIKNNLIFFSAGSGITPLFPMIKTELKKIDSRKITLIDGNKNESSIIFKEEIEELKKLYPDKFTVIHFLSSPSNKWKGNIGRITKESALTTLSSLGKEFLTNTEFYICGPESMMQNVKDALSELGIEYTRIHTENFSVKILHSGETIEQKEREVTVFIAGEKHKIRVLPGETILQKALENNIGIPNSCNYGSCGTCKARLLSGVILLKDQTVLTEQDIKHNYCLTCVGYPASDDVVVLYEDPFAID